MTFKLYVIYNRTSHETFIPGDFSTSVTPCGLAPVTKKKNENGRPEDEQNVEPGLTRTSLSYAYRYKFNFISLCYDRTSHETLVL
jgi:hypothetical protein